MAETLWELYHLTEMDERLCYLGTTTREDAPALADWFFENYLTPMGGIDEPVKNRFIAISGDENDRVLLRDMETLQFFSTCHTFLANDFFNRLNSNKYEDFSA